MKSYSILGFWHIMHSPPSIQYNMIIKMREICKMDNYLSIKIEENEMTC